MLTHINIYLFNEKCLFIRKKTIAAKIKLTIGPDNNINDFFTLSLGYPLNFIPKTDILIFGFAPTIIQAIICPISCKTILIIKNKNTFNLSNSNPKNINKSKVYSNYSTV